MNGGEGKSIGIDKPERRNLGGGRKRHLHSSRDPDDLAHAGTTSGRTRSRQPNLRPFFFSFQMVVPREFGFLRTLVLVLHSGHGVANTGTRPVINCPLRGFWLRMEREKRETQDTRYLLCLLSSIQNEVYFSNQNLQCLVRLRSRGDCTFLQLPDVLERYLFTRTRQKSSALCDIVYQIATRNHSLLVFPLFSFAPSSFASCQTGYHTPLFPSRSFSPFSLF